MGSPDDTVPLPVPDLHARLDDAEARIEAVADTVNKLWSGFQKLHSWIEAGQVGSHK